MNDQGALMQGLLASDAAGGGNTLMQINPGVMVWTLVIFLCLLFVLGKYAWRPILDMLRKREERIRDSLQKADQAARDAEQALAEQRAGLERERQEMAEAMRRVREEAENSARTLLERAHHETEELAERARRQVEDERDRAIEQIRREAVDIALDAATHLLGRTLSQDDHRRIVEDYVKALPSALERH